MAKVLDLITNNEEINNVKQERPNNDGFLSNIDFDDNNFGMTKIKVVGIGGAGCNVISYMCHYRKWPENVQLFAYNTDFSQLKRMRDCGCNLYLLAKDILKGCGSGGKPEIGMNAVQADEANIRKVLVDTDLLFIIAGLGKGTGSGGSPEFARIAKEMGITTVGIVNIPSIQAEGQEVYDNAVDSLNRLINNCDTISTISNDRIIGIDDDNTSMMDAFNKANHEVNHMIDTIVNIINEPAYINVDFADVRNFLLAAKSFNLLPVSINQESYSPTALSQAINHVLKLSYCNIPLNRMNNVLVNVSMPPHTDKHLISDLKNLLVHMSGNDNLWLVNGINEATDTKEIKMEILVALNMNCEEMINNLNSDQNYCINMEDKKGQLFSEEIPSNFTVPNFKSEVDINNEKAAVGLKTNTFIDAEQFATSKPATRSFHTTGRINLQDFSDLKVN